MSNFIWQAKPHFVLTAAHRARGACLLVDLVPILKFLTLPQQPLIFVQLNLERENMPLVRHCLSVGPF